MTKPQTKIAGTAQPACAENRATSGALAVPCARARVEARQRAEPHGRDDDVHEQQRRQDPALLVDDGVAHQHERQQRERGAAARGPCIELARAIEAQQQNREPDDAHDVRAAGARAQQQRLERRIERAAEIAGHARRRQHVVQHGRDERDERRDACDEPQLVGRHARDVPLVEREEQHGACGLEQRDEADRSKTYDERVGGEEHERRLSAPARQSP